jgi:hypothetical protein
MTLNVLSLGAGVQSTTVLLMSLHGELDPFDHVIFADTGWEPEGVYEHLELLHAECDRMGGPKITVVSAGNIRDDHLNPRDGLLIKNPRKHPEYAGRQRTFIPFYVVNDPTAKNPTGNGKTFRTCTKTYKIEPVEQHLRGVLGLRRGQPWPKHQVIRQSMGISLDEEIRMKESRRAAIVLEYPLIERRMTRTDCHVWLEAHGWTAPRSACIGCPFHRNDEWRRMRDTDPAAWRDAIEFDEQFRARQQAGLTPLTGTPYIHDQRVPLAEADIDDDDDQLSLFGTVFGAECEGLCGT